MKESIINKLIGKVQESGESSVYINSNRELAFFRCTGLREYNENRVVLKGADCELEIIGEALELKTFATSEISVSGVIKTLNYKKTTEADSEK